MEENYELENKVGKIGERYQNSLQITSILALLIYIQAQSFGILKKDFHKSDTRSSNLTH